MAIVRKTLDEIKAGRPRVDRTRLKATSEAQIQRYEREDLEEAAGESLPSPDDVAMRVRKVREGLNMTQEQFAKALHIPVATLRNWEQGRATPDPAVRSLLTIVAKMPKEAFEALET